MTAVHDTTRMGSSTSRGTHGSWRAISSSSSAPLEQFDVPVHLECTAHSLEYNSDEIVHTDDGELRSRTVIVAGGHGAFEPRRLPTSDIDIAPWEGHGARLLVGDKSEFAGERLVIVGSSDSAFNWIVNLLDGGTRPRSCTGARGSAHAATITEVIDHVEAGRMDLRVPCVIKRVHGDAAIEAIDLHREEDGWVETLDCDTMLLQLGFVTKLGPLKHWGFAIEKGSLVVSPLMRTNLDRVWACGDITTFDGKLKLIATGFTEAAIAVSQAVHHIPPETSIQPAYSTNTGVPGVVAGQH